MFGPEAILASIARQLSSPEPGGPVFAPALQIYSQREIEGFAPRELLLEESVKLTTNLTEYCRVTTIVLHALDECNPETRHLVLDALETIFNKSNGLVKIFVSSQEEGDPVCELCDYPNLRISSDRNLEDIELFVRNETECSEARDEVKALITGTLIKRADGM